MNKWFIKRNTRNMKWKQKCQECERESSAKKQMKKKLQWAEKYKKNNSQWQKLKKIIHI